MYPNQISAAHKAAFVRDEVKAYPEPLSSAATPPSGQPNGDRTKTATTDSSHEEETNVRDQSGIKVWAILA